MKLLKLEIEGVGVYRKPVVVDFASMPMGLVAITGPNGGGKSTLLECSGIAPLHRILPSKSQPNRLVDYASAEKSSIQLTFEAGGEVFRADWLQVKGAERAYLRHTSNFEPLNDGGQVSSYKKAVSSRFGTLESMQATAFAGQGGVGRFASLDRPARHALFAHYLGLNRYEAMAQEAQKRLQRLPLRQIETAIQEVTELSAREAVFKSDLEAARAAEQLALDKIKAAEAAWTGLANQRELFAKYVAYQTALTAASEARRRRLEADQASAEAAPIEDTRDNERALERAQELAAGIRVCAQENFAAVTAMRSAANAVARAERALQLLVDVPCDGDGVYAKCPLLADSIKDGKGIEQKRATLKAAEATYAQTSEALKNYERAEAGVPVIRAELERQRRVNTAHAALEARAADLRVREKETFAAAAAAKKALPAGLDPEQLTSAVERVRRDLESARANANGAVSQRAQLEGRLLELNRRLEETRAAIETAQQHRDQSVALQALFEAFGRSGLPTLEIAATGPVVSELTNELLDVCYGDRFRVEIVTERPNARETKTIDDFNVVVHDQVHNRSGFVTTLCGGEKVVVDEALSTALALFSAQRNPQRMYPETMWRDEPTAVLYGENKAKYVAMLARARVMGGYHHVLFVCDEDMAQGADVILRVENGTITRTK